ncbi:MAG TPA: hypothetical protein VHQ90_04930 [Thermoanaerobaculia bacterium]|nr:hypothetical protein [Thermoanaerobaculia bacterium]
MAFKYTDLMCRVQPQTAQWTGGVGRWACPPPTVNVPDEECRDQTLPGGGCADVTLEDEPECPQPSVNGERPEQADQCPDPSVTGIQQAGAVAPARLAAELALLQEQLRQCLAQSP